jgi:HPr kinase/phosphorylase
MPSITVRRLYQDNQQKLNLTWVAGTGGADSPIGNDEQRPTLALVGHLNFIHPNRVQVLGLAEVDYLNRLEQSAAKTALDQLFHKTMSVVMVANGQQVPKLLRDYCHTHNVPLMSTPLESPYLMDVLRIYLARALAVSTVLHGVFLDVLEIGVLIMGDSAMGKSELALELISRGHGMVADDAVELYRIGPETLEGRCPPLLRDFLEVRGLGILNIRTIFGETAVRPKKC